MNDSSPYPLDSRPSPRRTLAVPGVAMALVMAASGALPAAAATLVGRDGARLDQGALMANERSPLWQEGVRSEDDKRDNDKKKKKKQDDKKNSTKDSKKSSESNNKNTNSNQRDPKSDSRNNKLTEQERQRIYQQGREEGLQKGKTKGYNKGIDAGYQEGYDKGKDKGFRKGYDRAEQRKQWKAWNRNQWNDYNRNRRNVWVTPVQYNRGFYNNPDWARNSNWGNSRPWGGGWYNNPSGGWNNNPSGSWYNNSSNNLPWSWWGGQALGWGINALTTALIVNNAVNNAIRQQQPTVQVPRSNYNLYYGSVEPVDDTVVNFVVDNGGFKYQMEADCADGLLNGEVPTTLAEAELINTACQVTFGGT